LVDGVVIVVRSNTTTSVALRSAMDELLQADAPIAGIVLNDVDFAHPERYDDDSAAYYGSSYAYTAPLG
jgi:Mrp family chromosome partitioning ATPase